MRRGEWEAQGARLSWVSAARNRVSDATSEDSTTRVVARGKQMWERDGIFDSLVIRMGGAAAAAAAGGLGAVLG